MFTEFTSYEEALANASPRFRLVHSLPTVVVLGFLSVCMVFAAVGSWWERPELSSLGGYAFVSGILLSRLLDSLIRKHTPQVRKRLGLGLIGKPPQAPLPGTFADASPPDDPAPPAPPALAPETAWDRLSARHFLVFRSRGGVTTLSGSIRGQSAQVRRSLGGRIQYRIRVTLPQVPPSLAIRRGTGGYTLGDPILDARVRFDGDEAALRDWSRQPGMDALRGVLLEMLDRWPELQVRHQSLEYTVEEELGDRLESCVEDLVELAAHLNGVGPGA